MSLEVVDANQRNSPFLRLPAEHRNNIYELVFTGTKLRFSPGALYVPFNSLFGVPRRLAVLTTCKQIYNEAHGIAYANTTARITAEASFSTLGIKFQGLNPEGTFRFMTAFEMESGKAACILRVPGLKTDLDFGQMKSVHITGRLPEYFSRQERHHEQVTDRLRECFDNPELEVTFCKSKP